MYIANTLLPIFLIISLGLTLRKTGFVPDTMFKHSNRLVYWVALPCLLFIKTAQIAIQGGPVLRVVIVLIGGMFVCIVLGYIVSWILKVPGALLGTFIQGSFRGNLVYVGLPVIFFSTATQEGVVPPEIEALAILSIAPMVIVYNIISILVLLQPQMRGKTGKTGEQVRNLIVSLITNPLLIAVIIGIICNLSGLTLPLYLERFCSTVGQLALPLALLGVGASLRLQAFTNGLIYTVAASLIKVVAAPVTGFIICPFLGLTPVEMKIALLFLACPTAVVSFIMAEQLKGDGVLASGIILLSTLLSFLSFIIVLLIV